MALSRRLFLGGLLTAMAAPAIVTSKGFVPACAPIAPVKKIIMWGDSTVWSGTHTGRLSAEEPAWQELRRADELHPTARGHREALKRLLFCQRYGAPPDAVLRSLDRGPLLVNTDYSRMEARVLSEWFKG